MFIHIFISWWWFYHRNSCRHCQKMSLSSCLPPPSVTCIFVAQIQDASAASDAMITPLWPRQSLLWLPPPLPPLPAAVLSLLSLSATARLYCSHWWLVVASFPAHHPLPTQLSAAPIIDTFVSGCCAVLFSICAVLFFIAPLCPSTAVISLATAFNVPLLFS